MGESGATGSTGGDGDAAHGRVVDGADAAEHRQIAEGGGEETDDREQDDERAILRELDAAGVGPGSVRTVGRCVREGNSRRGHGESDGEEE